MGHVYIFRFIIINYIKLISIYQAAHYICHGQLLDFRGIYVPVFE